MKIPRWFKAGTNSGELSMVKEQLQEARDLAARKTREVDVLNETIRKLVDAR